MADTLNLPSSKEFEDAEKQKDGGNYSNGGHSNDDDDGLPKGRRIVYDKKFLLECFSLPSSKKKPVDFPLNDLECTLSNSKVLGQTPFVAPQPYVPPKRKEENGRRERTRDPDDNISLRPHSGNFSGGCGTSFPIGYGFKDREQGAAATGGLQHIIDEHFLRDSPRNTANFRFPNKRFDPGDRNRNGDRDRERDLRELRDRERERETDRERDRNLRSDRSHFNNHHRRPGGHNMQDNWGGGDVPDRESDWNRRGYQNRNGISAGPNNREFKDKRGNYFEEKSYGRGGHYKDREEEEPEWFSEGPSSQHDTIELRGFMDDDRSAGGDRRAESKEYSSGVEREKDSGVNDQGRNQGDAAQYRQAPEVQTPSGTDFSIEKILKMDHIPGLLPNGLLEDEEPSGISKFSQIFQKNLSSPSPRDDVIQKAESIARDSAKTNRVGASGNEDGSTKKEGAVEDERKEQVQVLSNALRNMLLKPGGESPKPVAKKVSPEVTETELLERNLINLVKPSQSKPNSTKAAKKTDADGVGGTDALQTLLSKLIESSQKPSGRDSAELSGSADNQERGGSGDMGAAFTQMLSQGMQANMLGPVPASRQLNGSPNPRPQENVRATNMSSPPVGNQNVRMSANVPPQNGNAFMVFQNLIRNQNPPNPPREVINPMEVMSMLPREFQMMVENVEPYVNFWREHDSQTIIAAMTSGEYAFRTLIQDLLAPRCDRRPFLASLVQMILSGAVIVPSLQIAGPPLSFMKTGHHSNKPVPNSVPPEMLHRMNLPNHEMAFQRAEREREMTRTNVAPPSNMAFTPTSVIRKMTADSPKPLAPHGGNMGMSAVGQSQQQMNASLGDFSFLVSQITGQNPQRPQNIPPQHNPMHAAPFMPIHQHSPMGPQGHPMMVPIASGQTMMNVPHHHQDIPRS